MQVVRSLSEIEYNKNSIVTLGTFDGVHRAHQELIKKVVAKAKQKNYRSVVVTFEPHPKEIVGGGMLQIDLLSILDEKLQLLEKLGVDVVFIIPFTFELSQKSYSEFYINYIINKIGVREVVEGYNHHLGKGRAAGTQEIVELGKQFNFLVETLDLLKISDETISSSSIRNLLQRGDVESANSMLGYRYQFSGTVVRGHGRGRKLGYPTANIDLNDKKKLLPKIGIYAVHFFVEGVWHNGMMSIGVIPTFYENHARTTEVNIFNFDKDIYDQFVTVECIARTRDEKKFNSVQDLVAEIGNDKKTIQKILENISQ